MDFIHSVERGSIYLGLLFLWEKFYYFVNNILFHTFVEVKQTTL